MRIIIDDYQYASVAPVPPTKSRTEKWRYRASDRIEWPGIGRPRPFPIAGEHIGDRLRCCPNAALMTAAKTREATMTDDPVELDGHRGMAAQKATEIRRRLQEVQLDQAALKARQAEFEKFLLAAPATTWPELAVKVRYLVELFAADAQDARRQKLIASVLEDLARLAE